MCLWESFGMDVVGVIGRVGGECFFERQRGAKGARVRTRATMHAPT